MTEDKKNQTQDQSNATDAWNEVGKQFQTLGESLASAFNATVQDEKVQQELKNMQSELNTAGEQISQKAKAASDSVKSIDVEEETKKLGEEAQTAGQDLVKDVQPHLLSALKKMQTSIDQAINDLEQQASSSSSAEDDAGSSTSTSESDE